MMYVEGIDDGRRFMEVARRVTAVKPVVVLRTGLTEFGSKAAASHTGAMAGSAAVWEAAARQSGIVTCASPDEVVDLGTCMAYLPLRTGRRVPSFTQGGGAGSSRPTRCPPRAATGRVARRALCVVRPSAAPVLEQAEPARHRGVGRWRGMPKILTGVAECDAVDAIIMMSVLGIPTSAAASARSAHTGISLDSAPGKTRSWRS